MKAAIKKTSKPREPRDDDVRVGRAVARAICSMLVRVGKKGPVPSDYEILVHLLGFHRQEAPGASIKTEVTKLWQEIEELKSNRDLSAALGG